MKKMSTQRMGWEGESVVQKDLIINQRLDVYTSIVDDNLCDMVVDTGKKLKRVQVKTRSTLRGNTSVEIKLTKYVKSKIDVIAIWYKPKDIIAYVPYKGEEFLLLAVETAKNNQEQGRNWFYRYMEFPL
tara:strand:- start:16847 stop:17233 length:387 start_codon:yes stop_codon:yes gene_type:complete